MVHLRNLCSKAIVNMRSLINKAKHCLLLALTNAFSTQHNAEMGTLTILRYSKFTLSGWWTIVSILPNNVKMWNYIYIFFLFSFFSTVTLLLDNIRHSDWSEQRRPTCIQTSLRTTQGAAVLTCLLSGSVPYWPWEHAINRFCAMWKTDLTVSRRLSI